MTGQEASERYNIPLSVLREYESWDFIRTGREESGSGQYDDTDLKYLSLLMTLHDIGFKKPETEAYMKLLLLGRADETNQRLTMLEQRRQELLKEIHFREHQLARLDYLRYSVRSSKRT